MSNIIQNIYIFFFGGEIDLSRIRGALNAAIVTTLSSFLSRVYHGYQFSLTKRKTSYRISIVLYLLSAFRDMKCEQ